MNNESPKMIEEWFADHSDDSEFVCHARATPYAVVGPLCDVGRIIFATKPTIVSAALDGVAATEILGMVGRYGLPSSSDLRWIRAVGETQELLFLGDMDPVDLMIFAWLRERIKPTSVVHLGVSDAYLSQLNISDIEALAMACSPSEQESLSLLHRIFPNLGSVVGAICADLLEHGRKIELDSLVSYKQSAREILNPVRSKKW